MDVISDLDMIFDHLREKGGQYMCIILSENKKTNDIGSFVMANLELSSLIKIKSTLDLVIKKRIEENTCDCDGCKKSIEILENWGNKSE